MKCGVCGNTMGLYSKPGGGLGCAYCEDVLGKKSSPPNQTALKTEGASFKVSLLVDGNFSTSYEVSAKDEQDAARGALTLFARTMVFDQPGNRIGIEIMGVKRINET